MTEKELRQVSQYISEEGKYLACNDVPTPIVAFDVDNSDEIVFKYDYWDAEQKVMNHREFKLMNATDSKSGLLTPEMLKSLVKYNELADDVEKLVKEHFAAFIGDAPETINTIKEIAEAINNNKELIDAISEAIGKKLSTEDFEQYKAENEEDMNLKADITYVDALRRDVESIHIPSRVSELENDVPYLTEHQDVSEFVNKIELNSYYTKDEVNNEIAETEEYLIDRLDEHQNILTTKVNKTQLTKYYTKAETDRVVADAISNIDTDVDLSSYAKKVEIPTAVSQLENDVPYLTEHQSLTAYAKKVEIPTKVSQLINDSGYLDTHQSLDNYALKSNVYTKEQVDSIDATKANKADVYTKAQVDTKIAQAAIDGAIDLDGYATKDEIPTKVSQLTNDSHYLTAANIANKANVGDSYTKSESDDKYLTEHQPLTAYAKKVNVYTKSEVDTKISQAVTDGTIDLDGYAKTTDIPTKVSQLTNDSRYVTRLDIVNKADIMDVYSKVDVDLKFADANYATKVDLSNYPLENTVYTKTDADLKFPTKDDVYTKDQVDTKLSSKADKSAIPTKVSQLTNDSGYVTNLSIMDKADVDYVVENYVKKTEFNKLSNNLDTTYAKRSELPIGLSDLANDMSFVLEDSILFTNRPTFIEVDEKLNNFVRNGSVYTINEMNEILNDYATVKNTYNKTQVYPKSMVYNKDENDAQLVKKANVVDVYTKSESDGKYLTEHQPLTAYAKKVDTYTKTEVDRKIAEVASGGDIDLDEYAKKTDIPTKVSQLTNDSGYLTTHQPLTNYYTKSEVDTAILNAGGGDIDLSNYYTKTEADGKYLTDAAIANKVDRTELDGYATTSDIPSAVSELTNDSGYITDSAIANKVNRSELADYALKSEIGDSIDLDNYYDKSSVDGLFTKLISDYGLVIGGGGGTVKKKSNILRVTISKGGDYVYVHTKLVGDTLNNYNYEWVYSKTEVQLRKGINDLGFYKQSTHSSSYVGTKGLLTVDLSDVDFYCFTKIGAIFESCINLTSANCADMVTSDIKELGDIFRGCSSLTDIDLSGWDTSNVETIYSVFQSCTSLTDIDLSGWDTSKVTYIASLFMLCNNLNYVDLSGWDLSNCESVSQYCFYNCNKLTSIKVAGCNSDTITKLLNSLSQSSFAFTQEGDYLVKTA